MTYRSKVATSDLTGFKNLSGLASIKFLHWLGNWLLLASLALCRVPLVANAAAGSWSFTGVMSVARELHTFTKLNDRRVLVVGGSDGTAPLANKFYA